MNLTSLSESFRTRVAGGNFDVPPVTSPERLRVQKYQTGRSVQPAWQIVLAMPDRALHARQEITPEGLTSFRGILAEIWVRVIDRVCLGRDMLVFPFSEFNDR